MLSSMSALPEGSLVLLTGATSFLSTHIIQQLLRRGYRVRGTVRDRARAGWLVDDLFKNETSSGAFELAVVEDMAVAHAFDEAARGVTGIVHVATDVSWSGDPNVVIPPSLAGMKNVLEAAAKEGSVKRFVYTSSVAAAAMPIPNTKWHMDKTSWNDLAVQIAWAPPPYDGRGPLVYSAAKTESEKSLWKFVGDENPRFAVNTVLAFLFVGPLLHEKQNPSTASMIWGIDSGNTAFHLDVQSSEFTSFRERETILCSLTKSNFADLVAYIDIADVANLHVAALLDPTVNNERIQAWDETNTWDKFVSAFQKIRPEKSFSGLPEGVTMLGTVDNKLGKDLLKKWTGQDDWISVEESIKRTLDGKKPAQLTLGYSY
ncbi:hypothetical protein LTR84_002897 [Exophiala bonariae]|uniref:NAD-dependent epimerase/dehydratase domain-containing protein n=1 Tax=Exophiala bonariae TaxID=1690606 RepID=A0AAV9N977_9EURO|nr:hypothetical protein LTR84_002897 [Exophiala bonariae]